MSSKKKLGIAAGALLALVLAALGIYRGFFAPKGYTQNLTDPALSAGIVADYTGAEAARSETFASGSKGYSWENGDPFNVWWKAENAVYDGGKLTLKLSEMTQKEQVWGSDGTASDCLSEYYGAEVRSEHYYGYGDFQVRMKPAAIPGTASTFFTCTGPYDVWYNPDGSVQRANDHDEIDIEFLGKDTTKVQFNYFASGKGGHEYMYDLGFDASKDFHNYGYRWSEESITWFVDDKPVYKVLRSEIPAGEDWPEDPGRIVMNYWCGTSNAALWMGTFQNDYSAGAEYEWVSSSAAPQPDPSSTKPAEAGQPSGQPGTEGNQTPDTQWAELDLSAFVGWGKYTVTKDAGKVTISHDKKLQKYDCCGVDLALGSRNKVAYTVTNTGKEKAFAKVSVKSTAVDKSAITSATVNGGDAGYYEYGVLCELAPGQSADVVMLLDLGQKPSQLVVSLNSEADSEGKALRSDMPKTGSIVISNLKAVKTDETALPGAGQGAAAGTENQTSGGPKAPEGPVTQWGALDVSAFDGWGKYTVTRDAGKVTVSHSKKLQKYDCCGTDLALGGRNKVAYTVTNTGKEKAFAKVSVKSTSVDKSAITSATINGGDAGYYEYGVLCELAPGQSADVVMLLDLGQKPSQLVVSLNSEADSEGKALRSDMPKTGSIVISNLKAVKTDETALPGAGARPQQNDQSQQGQEPKAPEGPVTQPAALDLSAFDGWGKYTVAKADGAITVSHDKTMAMYDCCGVDVNLGERNKVQFTLTNNSPLKAFAKVNLKDRTDATGVSSIQAAAVNGAAVDYVLYGVLCELEPGQSAQVELYVDGVHPADQLVLSLNSEGDDQGKALRADMPAAGSVTLSNVQAVKAESIPAVPGQTQQPGQAVPPSEQNTVPDTQWANVDLSAVDGWGKYTVGKTGSGFTVSHDKAVSMYDCCGGQIALGSRNKVRLTLTNTGKDKVFAKVNINDKTVTTGLSSISSATVNGADAGYIEYGVLCELPAGQSAQLELLLAPGKAADQLVISLDSEGDSEGKALRSDMPKSGSVTISDLQAIKTDETSLTGTAVPEKKPAADVPLDQWADIDLSAFDGWGMYTVEKSDGSVTMSHDKALKQYACAGMNYDAGERNKVKMTIKNNGAKTAEAKVSIKSDKVDTSAILGATIDGKAVSDATYGVMCKVPAGKSVELVVFLDLKKDIKQLVVSLNSEKARGGLTAGSITISELQAMKSDEKFKKATGGSDGGGGGGGGGDDGGYTPPPPAVPGADGKLSLNPSSSAGYRSTYTTTSAGDGGVTISHSQHPGVYGNVSWPISMKGNNKLELDLANNGDTKAFAKVSLTTEGDNSGISVLESATVEKTAAPARMARRAAPRAADQMTGDAVKYGVMCELEPGQSAHVVMIVQQAKLSQANKLVVSLNSEGENDTTLQSAMPAAGSVTLKNMVCTQQAVEPEPVDENLGVKIGATVVKFTGESYTVKSSSDKSAMTVTYTDVSGKGYTNLTSEDMKTLIGENNTLSFQVENKGEAEAKVRVDVLCNTGKGTPFTKGGTDSGNNDFCNTAASYTGAASHGNDYDYEGADWFKVAPGQTAAAVITFTNTAEVGPKGIKLFIDSSTYDDQGTHSGQLAFSGFTLTKVSGTDPDPGDQDVPVPTPVHESAGEGWTDISLTDAWSSGGDPKDYVLTPSADGMALTVSHQSKATENACAGRTGFDLEGSKELKVKLKNNAGVKAYVKVNVKKDGDSATTAIKSATVDGVAFTGYKDYGILCEIAGNGETVVVMQLEDSLAADALTLSLNSEGGAQADSMPAKGSVSLVTAAYKTPGPDTGDDELTDIDLSGFDGWGKYTIDKTSGLSIRHASAPTQYDCCGMDLVTGNAATIRLTIKNNLSDEAIVKVSVKKGSPEAMAITAASITGTGATVDSDVTYGAKCTLQGNAEGVLTLTIDPTVGADKFVISLNSEDASNPADGNVTITSAKWDKTGAAAAAETLSLFSMEEPEPQPAPPPADEGTNAGYEEDLSQAEPPAAPVPEEPEEDTSVEDDGETKEEPVNTEDKKEPESVLIQPVPDKEETPDGPDPDEQEEDSLQPPASETEAQDKLTEE